MKPNKSSLRGMPEGVQGLLVALLGDELLLEEFEERILAFASRELNAREFAILLRCFGLGGHPKMTLAEISLLLAPIKPQRVQQLRNRALQKLRWTVMEKLDPRRVPDRKIRSRGIGKSSEIDLRT